MSAHGVSFFFLIHSVMITEACRYHNVKSSQRIYKGLKLEPGTWDEIKAKIGKWCLSVQAYNTFPLFFFHLSIFFEFVFIDARKNKRPMK